MRPRFGSRPLSLITAVALGAASAGSIAHAATQWLLCDLGTLGGSQSWAWSISGNNSTDPDAPTAVIVGASYTSGNSAVRAFSVAAQLENNVLSSSMTALDVGGYVSAEARGISASSFNIVGLVHDSQGSIKACYWDDDGNLQTLAYANGPAVGAFSVNDDGYIVGTEYQYSNPGNYQATMWYGDNSPDPMGTLEGLSSTLGSYAFAVNDGDVTVAKSQNDSSVWLAFRTSDWEVADSDELAALQGASNCEALGINDSDVAVGDSDGYATEWPAGSTPTAQQLYSSTGGQCQANAINNNNVIVGARAASGGSTVAVIWLNSTTSTDLLSLNPTIVGGGTWTLITATAINDENWIVGWGLRNGYEHAFVLLPKQLN